MFDIEHLLLSRVSLSGAWGAHATSAGASAGAAWWADPDDDVWIVMQGCEAGRPVHELAYGALHAFSLTTSFPDRVSALCRAAERVDPRCGGVSLLAIGRHEGRICTAGVGIKVLYRLRDGTLEPLCVPETLGRRRTAEGLPMTPADPGYFVPVRQLRAGEQLDLDVLEVDACAGDRLVLCVGPVVAQELTPEQVHRCIASRSPREAVCALDAAGRTAAGYL